jgi:multiple sugar transport system substrate-binding protein
VLNYWEKWSGFEMDAMQAVVDAYNASQEKVFVRLIPTSGVDRKLIVATAAGDPPDLAGIWTWAINIYSDKNALMDLTPFCKEAGIKRGDYVPVFWDECNHRGKVWGLPTTVATIGLHWNKRLFRENGLDPNTPPKTIAELDAMNEKLTFFRLPDGSRKSYAELGGKIPDGSEIVQMGFLPFEPDWFTWSWGYYFGGNLWNGVDKITCTDTGNTASMEWLQKNVIERYGKERIEKFYGGFQGVFASSQNAFMCGKVAMVMQGVWMYNFIDKYSAGMDWGAAAIPTHDGVPVAYTEADVLVIPAGARHPKESFDFIKYVNSQGPQEMLAMGQRKFSPRAAVTDTFYATHPNPYINVFRNLAELPRTFTTPATGIWNEYAREISVAYTRVRRLEASPETALEDLRARVQEKLDGEIVRLRRRGRI